MKKLIASLLLVAALATFATGPQALAKPGCPAKPHPVKICASVYGVCDFDVGAWVGGMWIKFGDGEPKQVTFIDRNTGFTDGVNGAYSGPETYVVTFVDGSGSFEIMASFQSTPAGTPNLAILDETGTIVNGTGAYRNLSGHIYVKGPYMDFWPTGFGGPNPFLGELHGEVTGLPN